MFSQGNQLSKSKVDNTKILNIFKIIDTILTYNKSDWTFKNNTTGQQTSITWVKVADLMVVWPSMYHRKINDQ